MRVLLVEDDSGLGSGLQQALKAEGYTVDWLTDGLQALQALETDYFDLAVLDLGLPRLDGLSVLRQIRTQGKDIPVLILTARDAVQDRINGLDSGADDYLVKPFDMTELKARIRALQRRSSGRTQPTITLRDIEINPASQQVLYNGNIITLTRREYTLLYEMMSQPSHVFTRDRLQQLLYGWDEDVESNAMEVHIHHLRKKLFPKLIRTLRGIGYVIDKTEA
ncbi:response regulator [Oceanospirillum linum]|uniref:DNA-binding response regulator n=1 Tax=Oceanospirillum linum TaxID=966 RepID=A0A1T1H9M7_OCELI|nr:response regulator [Oceanospirillum linum]OOV86564.1 DNA-binding response regulator [Oceanospirillum linum]SEG29846.1 two-component system, OmpR family, response regulator [Oleiphilus messinensis]SMP26222.1 two-component system, OmpR family, response regulator QseB [Oceanospirillum linum]